MDAHKGAEVERVHVAVPAGESSWLMDGVDWESSPALPWTWGEPWWRDHGGLSGLPWGPAVLLCPIWAKRRWNRGGPTAYPHLGLGNSSREDALFPLNEHALGQGWKRGY